MATDKSKKKETISNFAVHKNIQDKVFKILNKRMKSLITLTKT